MQNEPQKNPPSSSVGLTSPTPIDEMTFNTTPNHLSLFRIAMVPAVVACLYQKTIGYDIIATVLFVVAAITDFFDGYLARTRKLITVYGKLLDPLADKFLVVVTLIMLQELGRIHPIVVMLLVCREFAITGLRALASAEGVIIAASGGGKWKTATQMVAIPILMVHLNLFDLPLIALGQVLLYTSLGLSLWSAKDYAVDFFKALAKRQIQKRRARKEKRLAKKRAKTQGRAQP